ncbi:hypothetical protein OsJ_12961 [Oryza sativa Japonica Group]|uniref:Uncharacterized protein n=1 Tax=Oryza sativa subsp. japonica TaxID=39947 RepID=B9F6G7_ORYSJ|nr:hypothetical protein OsJ_12961 [Oryza sativa Japonica Group]
MAAAGDGCGDGGGSGGRARRRRWGMGAASSMGDGCGGGGGGGDGERARQRRGTATAAALVNAFVFGQANTRHSSRASLQEKLKREVPGGKMADCCVFLRWPLTLPSLLGYRSLDNSKVAGLSSPAVTVVVEKEW